MPFGQMPILEMNGKIANQSIAIARYAAKQAKLVGDNDWENLEIDSMVDNINDLRASEYRQCNRFSYTIRVCSNFQNWPNTITKVTKKSKLNKKQLCSKKPFLTIWNVWIPSHKRTTAISLQAK